MMVQEGDKVYVVLVNDDATEGLGPMVVRGLFIDREQAEKFAVSQECYGFYGQMTSIDVMYLYDNGASHPSFNRTQYDKIMDQTQVEQKLQGARAAAIAKLTPDERRLLGIIA